MLITVCLFFVMFAGCRKCSRMNHETVQRVPASDKSQQPAALVQRKRLKAVYYVPTELIKVARYSRRLLKMVWQRHPVVLVANAALILVLSFLPFLLAFSTGELINSLLKTQGEFTSTAVGFLVLLAAAGAGLAMFTQLQAFASLLLSKRLWNSFAIMITERIAALEISVHEDPGNQNTFQKISENAPTRVPFYVERLFFLLQNVLEVAIAVTIMVLASWWVALLLLAGWLPRFAVELWYGRAVYALEGDVAGLRRKYWWGRWALINVDSLVEIKLSGNVGHFVKQLEDFRGQILDREVKLEKRSLVCQLAATGFSQIMSVGAIGYFVWLVVHGRLEVGTLAFYLGSIASLGTAVSNLSRNLGRQFQDGMFVQEMFKLFDQTEAPEEAPKFIPIGGGAVPRIEFRAMEAAYNGQKKPVLQNINLVIEPGTSLGIVGVNEAGKSTLVKFLCGFYRPRSGQILVNGVDLRDVDLENDWWPRLGVLLQGFWDYPFMTAKEAIAIGGRNSDKGVVDMDRVRRAAHAADIHQSIERLPLQYDTPLSPWFGGVKLSGGANQKIGLARVDYRNPQVVVLDEPTAAIDGDAEQRIFDRLIRQPDGRTKILISHRYYTLRHADQIIVIDGGRIVECGSHAQLMAQRGIYFERFTRQAEAYWGPEGKGEEAAVREPEFAMAN